MIPTSSDLDAWVAALKTGHAVTGMLPRFVEGYRRLLKVAEATKRFIDEDITDYRSLENALDALEAPVPETEVNR
jgi:hypothetical protein